MQRVTRPSAVAAMPAPPVSPGPPGFFTSGDPITGTPATVPGQEWFNGVQEELAGLIEWAGLPPAANDLTQLRKAVARLGGGNVRTVTANTALGPDDAGLVLASAAGGNRTLTLPLAAEANGRPIRLTITRVDAAANALNLLSQGADTCNGLTGSLPLPVGATVTLLSDGVSAWRLTAASGLAAFAAATVSGNVVVPWWSRTADVTVVGGGGAGGYNGSGYASGGGGAGGAAIKLLTGLAPGMTIACTIGAGGTVSGSTPMTGGSGGTSSFGSYCSATGGAGGGQATTDANPGGGGGVGIGGDINLQGGMGTDGFQFGASSIAGSVGGSGGQSLLGGGLRGGTGFAAPPTGAGYGSGGAGGGANTTQTGGAAGSNGRSGIILIRWLP